MGRCSRRVVYRRHHSGLTGGATFPPHAVSRPPLYGGTLTMPQPSCRSTMTAWRRSQLSADHLAATSRAGYWPTPYAIVQVDGQNGSRAAQPGRRQSEPDAPLTPRPLKTSTGVGSSTAFTPVLVEPFSAAGLIFYRSVLDVCASECNTLDN